MIRHEDAYYVFTGGDGITIRRSLDTVKWEKIGTVLPGVPDWAEDLAGGSLWAPDVSYFNGRYHLYYSASTLGSNNSAIGLATTPTLDPADPEYEWVDHGKILRSRPSDDFNAIDANLVPDAEDEPWLCYGSYWSGIKLQKIEVETGQLSPEEAQVYDLAQRTFHRHGTRAVEAPYIVHRGEHYYLFVSFEPQFRNYHVRVGRSRSIAGPYVDRNGRAMMDGGGTLILDAYDHIDSPGHNGVLLDDGGRDWFVYHYWDERADRAWTLGLRRLVWDEDGWPLVGTPHSRQALEPTAQPLTEGSWQHAVGFDQPWRELRFRTDDTVRLRDDEGTWERSGDTLILRWPDARAEGGSWVDRLTVSECGRWYVGRNRDGRVVRGRRPPD